MAPYFDHAKAEHLALLPPSLQDHEDLAGLAAAAEAAVLAALTRMEPHPLAVVVDAELPTRRYVWLLGYAEDAEQASPALRAALRREIANAMRWEAARLARKPNLESETAGEPMTSKQYRADAEATLPPNFGDAVAPFRIRPVVWSL